MKKKLNIDKTQKGSRIKSKNAGKENTEKKRLKIYLRK